jgi:hypothetical protein
VEVSGEQKPRQMFSRRARWAAAMSLVLGLISIVLNIWPALLVLPLQSWLGEYPPLFLPLAVGASASGLGVLGLVWAPRLSWIAIVGLGFGTIGVALGSLLAVTTVTMLLQYEALRISLLWFTPAELFAALGRQPAHLANVLRRERLAVEGEGRNRKYPRPTVKTLQDVYCRGIGLSTSNGYATTICTFSRWLAMRIGRDMLASLKRLNAGTDLRHERRALDVNELQAVLSAAVQSPTDFQGLSGADRLKSPCAFGAFRAVSVVLRADAWRMENLPHGVADLAFPLRLRHSRVGLHGFEQLLEDRVIDQGRLGGRCLGRLRIFCLRWTVGIGLSGAIGTPCRRVARGIGRGATISDKIPDCARLTHDCDPFSLWTY